MESWIYIFSQFTPEALLFEGLIICTLCSGYAAYWVLKKRRLGVAQTGVPASVVKTYLTSLIGDAEQMQAQLFGLLQSTGITLPKDIVNQAPQIETNNNQTEANDPALLSKIAALESKMLDQTKTMQTLLMEKQKIEEELKTVKSAGTQVATPSGDNNAAIAELQSKIQVLQSKLDEYSVIEDDLANLKRLQQENAQLKAALDSAGAVSPTATVSPATAAAAASATTAKQEKKEAVAPVAAQTPPKESTDPLAALTDIPAATVKDTGTEPNRAAPVENFDKLVDNVEQSLLQNPAVMEVAPTLQPASATTPAPAASSPSTPAEPPKEQTAAGEKKETVTNDADLVAEFEKMLNA